MDISTEIKVRKQSKSLRLQVIEALGIKQILVNKFVYRPPRTTYAFQPHVDFLQNKRFLFCILNKKRKVPIRNPNVEINPYLVLGRTSYCPIILLTSVRQQCMDSVVQTTPNHQRSLSSYVDFTEDSIKFREFSQQRTISNALITNINKVRDDMLVKSYVATINEPRKNTFKYTKGQRILVIFSHGNASDLGDVYFFGERLVNLYDVDFIAYDYTGYGLGKDRYDISEKQIYDDLQNIIAFATMQLNYKLNQIILWGFSLGSGPTVELASRFPSIGGVVLQAPLASLILWLENERENITPSEQDLYSNINKIQSIRSKILIIHGNKDQVINIRHSRMLYQKHITSNDSNNSITFLEVGNVDHNDLQEVILQSDGEVFYRISSFLSYIEQQKFLLESMDEDLLRQKNRAKQDYMERDMGLLSLIYQDLTVSSETLDVEALAANKLISMASSTKTQIMKQLDEVSFPLPMIHSGSYHDVMGSMHRSSHRQSRRNIGDKRNYFLFCGCNEVD